MNAGLKLDTPKDLYRRVRAQAAHLGVSVSNVVELKLERWLCPICYEGPTSAQFCEKHRSDREREDP